MGEVLTRDRWNGLVQQYNDYVGAIDPECEPPEPLELVPTNHVWTKSDVQTFQERLIELCDCNSQLVTFADLPDLWQTKIIEDIEFALSIGSCIQGDPDPIVIDLGDFGPCINLQCGTNEPTTECVGSGQAMPVDLSTFLTANAQEPVRGDVTRVWKITEERAASPVCEPFADDGAISERVIFTGIIKCTGELEPPEPTGPSPGPGDIFNYYFGEFLVVCTPDCNDDCLTVYNNYKGCAAGRAPRHLRLTIQCFSCQTCEELGYGA